MFFFFRLFVERILVVVVFVLFKEGLGLQIVIHLNHALCKLNTRQSHLLVHLHLTVKLFFKELVNRSDLLTLIVFRKRLEVEIDPVGEVKVSAATFQKELSQFFVF